MLPPCFHILRKLISAETYVTGADAAPEVGLWLQGAAAGDGVAGGGAEGGAGRRSSLIRRWSRVSQG